MTSLFWIDYRHTTRTTTRGDITVSNPLKIFRQTEWNCTKAKLSQDALAYIITILTAVSRVKSTSPILSGLANSHHFTLYRTTRVISDQAHFCGRLVFFLLQAKQDASQNTRMCRSSGWEELCEFPSSSVPSRYNMPVESSIKIVRHNLSFIGRELLKWFRKKSGRRYFTWMDLRWHAKRMYFYFLWFHTTKHAKAPLQKLHN